MVVRRSSWTLCHLVPGPVGGAQGQGAQGQGAQGQGHKVLLCPSLVKHTHECPTLRFYRFFQGILAFCMRIVCAFASHVFQKPCVLDGFVSQLLQNHCVLHGSVILSRQCGLFGSLL